MSNLKFETQIVLDSGTSINSIRTNGKTCKYTEQGMLIYPIGMVVPVIVRERGCVGTAIIKEIRIKMDITTIIFDINEIDQTTAKILYSMYKNNNFITSSTNDDPYSTDISIPGAAINAPTRNLADNLSDRNINREIYDTISGGKRGTQKNRRSFLSGDDDDDNDR